MSLSPEYAVLPIDVLRPHEQYVEDRVVEVLARMRETGRVSHPIVVDRETHTILDGHHRYEALRRMGCARAPVALVNYSDPAIRVDSWQENVPSPTKDDVVRHALAGKLYPPKSTRHRVFYALPAHPMDVDDLQEP